MTPRLTRTLLGVPWRNTETVLIDAPVASGDMVVTEGTQSVSEGGDVRIAGQGSATEAEGS